MKRIMLVAAVAAVVLSPVLVSQAQEGGAKPRGEFKRPALTEMTVSGKVSKEEVAGRNGKNFSHFVLTSAAGEKVILGGGEGRGGKAAAAAAAPAFQLGDYVGKDVTVTGKGFTSEREGKKVTRLVEITKIDVAAPAAAPAPAAAAPAAAPAAK